MIRLSLGGSLLLLLLFFFLAIGSGEWRPFLVNLGLIIVQLVWRAIIDE